MTRVKERRCDVCDDVIGRVSHLRLKRFIWGGFLARFCSWGITDIAPVTDGWNKWRVDICRDCWDEILDEISERCIDR